MELTNINWLLMSDDLKIFSEILKELSPSETIVINFGSAGSSDYKIGELIKCLQFQQGDIDTKQFAKKYVTPFDDIIYPKLEAGILTFGNSDVCFTTDTFQSNTKRSVCDMEAYSIAKVCKIYGFDFVSYKFISDNGDANDWKKNHNKGIQKFLQKLKDHFRAKLRVTPKIEFSTLEILNSLVFNQMSRKPIRFFDNRISDY